MERSVGVCDAIGIKAGRHGADDGDGAHPIPLYGELEVCRAMTQAFGAALDASVHRDRSPTLFSGFDRVVAPPIPSRAYEKCGTRYRQERGDRTGRYRQGAPALHRQGSFVRGSACKE